MKIAFKKIFFPENFEKALDENWQTTTEVATKVGCSRQWADQVLTEILKSPDYNGKIFMRKIKAQGRFNFTKQWKKVVASK